MIFGQLILLLQSYQLFSQPTGDLLCSPLSVDVVGLVWIVLQIIELPVLLSVEMNQLVAFCLHPVVGTYAVEAGVLVVVVVERSSPILGCPACIGQLPERLSLHIVRYIYATEVEQGGGKVD